MNMKRKRIIIISLFAILLLMIAEDQYFSPSFRYIPGNDTAAIQKDNSDGLININTASKNDLAKLDGIGEGLAERIIEYRNTAPFNDITEIMNVKGIGKIKFENIRNYIKVK